MSATHDWLSRRNLTLDQVLEGLPQDHREKIDAHAYELILEENARRLRRGVVYEIPPFPNPKREAEYQRHAPPRARVRWLP